MEVRALVVRFERASGHFRKKQNIGVHIYLDPAEGEIIILTQDDDLRQKIRAKISQLKRLSKNDIKEFLKGGALRIKPILRKIKNALLNRKRGGIFAKEAEYLSPSFHIVKPV